MKNAMVIILILFSLFTHAQISNYIACTLDLEIQGNASSDTTVCYDSNVIVVADFSMDCGMADDLTFDWSEGSTNEPSLFLNDFKNSRPISLSIKDMDGIEIVTNTINIVAVSNYTVDVVVGMNSDSLCVGNYIELTAMISGQPTGNVDYSWSNGITDNDATVQIPSASAETEIYRVTVTDEKLCTRTRAKQVTIHPLPSVSITGPVIYCEGDNLDLDVSPSGISCFWTLPDGSNPDFCALNSPAISGPYSVIVTDGSGCTNMAPTNINVTVPNLNLDPPGDNEYCVNADPFDLNLSSSSGTYSISPSDQGDPFNGNEFDPNKLEPDNYTITYTINQGPCLGRFATAEVTIKPLPIVTWDQSTLRYCQNSDVINLFDFVNPSGGMFFIDGILIDGANFNPANYSVETLSVEYRVFLGCENSQPKDIEIFEAFEVEANADLTVCSGANITLGATATGGSGSPSFSWLPIELLNDPNVAFPIAQAIEEETVFTVFVEDEIGCMASSSQTIEVELQATVRLRMEPQGICQGEVANLIATLEDGVGTPTFYWNEVGQPQGPATMESTFVTPELFVNTNYEVTVKFNSNDAGCNDATSDPILIIPQEEPEPNINYDELVVCSNQTTLFVSENRKTGSVFDWDIFVPIPNVLGTEELGPIFIVQWGENSVGTTSTINVQETLSNDCFGIDQVNVTFSAGSVPEPAEIFLAPINNILIYNDSSACAYKWSYFDPNFSSADGKGKIFTDLDNNTFQSFKMENPNDTSLIYFCQAWSDSDGCETPDCSTTAIFRHSAAPPSETPTEEEQKFNLYPNPNYGTFTLEVNKLFPNAEHEVQIFNSLGVPIHSETVFAQEDKIVLEIESKDRTAGVYYLALRFKGEVQQVKGFVINPN